MESVISFPLKSRYENDRVVKLESITEKHIIGNGYSIRDSNCYSFTDFLDSKFWEESKVGKKDGTEVDTNIRSSKYLSVKLNFSYESKDLINENMKRLVPNKYQNIIDKDEYDFVRYTALKYEEGGKFLPHRDTKTSKRHFGTILLFPPSDYTPHNGGILRICDDKGDWHEFDSSNMKEWTVVMFNPLMEHEVTEITSGTRIVFKRQCSFDEDLFELLNVSEKLKSKTFELKTEVVENEKEEDERLSYFKKNKLQILELLSEMEKNFVVKDNDFEFNSNNYYYQYEELESLVSSLKTEKLPTINRPYLTFDNFETTRVMKEIDKSDENIIILILKNYYDNTNLEWLYQQDYDLYNSIKERYNESYISNFNEKYVNGELSEYDGIGRYLRRDDRFYISSFKYPIRVIRLGDGKRVSSNEEYNDSDYDTVNWYSMTCIVINKV
jgi:hypothetical protein